MNRGDWIQILILILITLTVTGVIYTLIAGHYFLFALESLLLIILIYFITRKVKL
ncbi:MAG: hypothetical protein ACK4IY_05580 [Chitinophagales bacterium]